MLAGGQPNRRLQTVGLVLFFLPLTMWGQEWLTDGEIEKLRERQELFKRVEFYIEAVELRIQAAEDRMEGKSTKEGDPFEFHSPVDLIKGCQMALRSTMLNIEDQVTYKKAAQAEITKALKKLKKSTESFLPRFKKILDTSLEKRNEPLARITHECIQFSDSAIKGASQVLEKLKNREPDSIL